MTQKVRNSNLELYRIITMLAIVAHHYVVNSGLMGGAVSEEEFNSRNLFFLLFGMWGKTGINCFVLITGYFMCQQQITLSKFLKLILQVEFYNLVISAVFLLVGFEGFTMKEFCLQLFPVKNVASGFISCFLLFYLSIPFLNVLIQHISRRMHLMLIALCLFTYTIILYVPYGWVSMNYVSWFIVLYFISSYIRMYPESVYKSNSAKTWGWLSLLAILLAIGSVLVRCWLNDAFETSEPVYWYVSDSNAILALMVGITSFMYFKNLKMSPNRFINAVAATTFGVLLIHANSDAMRQWLWKDTVDCVGHYNDTYYYFYALIAVLCIFAVCSMIDYVRIHTFEKWTFNYLDKKWLKRI